MCVYEKCILEISRKLNIILWYHDDISDQQNVAVALK